MVVCLVLVLASCCQGIEDFTRTGPELGISPSTPHPGPVTRFNELTAQDNEEMVFADYTTYDMMIESDIREESQEESTMYYGSSGAGFDLESSTYENYGLYQSDKVVSGELGNLMNNFTTVSHGKVTTDPPAGGAMDDGVLVDGNTEDLYYFQTENNYMGFVTTQNVNGLSDETSMNYYMEGSDNESTMFEVSAGDYANNQPPTYDVEDTATFEVDEKDFPDIDRSEENEWFSKDGEEEILSLNATYGLPEGSLSIEDLIGTLPELDMQLDDVLANIPPEKIGELEELIVKWLKAEMAEAHDSEMKSLDHTKSRIDETVNTQDARKPGTQRSVGPSYKQEGQTPYGKEQQPAVTSIPEDYWQPYIFDTGVGNRRDIKIEGVNVEGVIGGAQAVKIIPIGLREIPVIYVNHDGFGYIEIDGKLQRLVVLNEWTQTPSGCQCGQDYSTKGCACCMPGGCVCQGQSMCVACGQESSCHGAALPGVLVSAAAGTVVSAQDGSLHITVLAVAHGGSVNFFSVLPGGSLRWLGIITPQQEVTHMGFGTIFVDHDEATIESTFLILFSSSAMYHQYHEIIVSSIAPTFTVGPPLQWQAKGKAMTVFQSNSQVLVSVHSNNYINMFTLQEDLWMKSHIVQVHSFKGAFQSLLIFMVDFETYVALAARRHIVFYRCNFLEEEFEQVNTLYMDNALSNIQGLVSVNVGSCKEDVSVVVAGHGKHLAVFVLHYNLKTSKHWFALEFESYLKDSLDWSTTASNFFGTSRLVGVAAGRREVVVIGVKTTIREVKRPMQEEGDIIENSIEYIKRENNRQQSVVAAAEARLAQSVMFSNTVSANVTITGSITVSGVLSTGSLSAIRLVFPGTDLEHGVTHLQYLQHLSSANPSLEVSKNILLQISTMENILSNAVPVSGPNKTIDGVKTFVIINRLVLNSVIIERMSVGRLLDSSGADFPLNETLSSLVRMSQLGQVFRGRKTFASRFSIQLLHTTFLDDIKTSDLLTTSGTQNIAGAIFASGLWSQDIKMSAGGTVGGIDFNNLVLVGQSAVLGTVKLVSREFVARVVDIVSGTVGGMNLARLYNQTLLVTGGQFSGSVILNTDLMVEDLVAEIMMGINMRSLVKDVVFKDEDAVLTGQLHIRQTVTVEGGIRAETINGQKFPESYAVKIGSESLVFTNEVSFDHVAFGEVTFGPRGSIDGIAPNLLMTKSTDQTVSGRKVFNVGVDVTGHLDISSKILDGVDLDNLFSGDGRPSSLPSDWKFTLICKRDIWLQRILTQGTVNGGDMSVLARDIVYMNEEKVLIAGRKEFLNGISVSTAVFQGDFNGLDLGTLVTTDTELVISGALVFARNIFVKSLVTGSVGGINLKALIDGALHLNKAGQVVIGQKVFLKKVVVESLVIEGRVEGLNLGNFVTKSSNQTFTAPQVFNIASFSSINTNAIKLSEGLSINGVDLSRLAQRRVSLREPVGHTSTLSVEGLLEVDGVATVETLNGVNLGQLLSTIVTDDRNFTIDGPVSISSLRVFGSITTQGGVGGSGVSLRDLADKAIRLSGNNQIGSHLSFMSVQVRGDIPVGGLVEGASLQRLHQDAVYTDVQSLQTIAGVKMFDQGFTVRGNIHAKTINGIDLARSLFTRTTDQVITAPVTFLSVSAHKNVFLQGLFNSFDLKALAQDSIMRGKKEELITGNITFSGRVTVKNLVLHGVLQGDRGSIDLIAHLTDAVRLQDSAITVTGRKIFTAGISFGNLHAEVLNGHQLDHFLAMVVTRNKPHTLTGSVKVQGVIIAPWVTAQQAIIQGTVDGVDLTSLRKSVVFLAGHQSVDASLVFRQPVLVRRNLQTEMLNDVSLAEGYFTTTTEQTINLNFTMLSAHATEVEVNGLVNSWNLREEWNKTLMALGGQNVLTSFVLSGTVLAKNVAVTGRVGRERMVKLSTQVILLDRRTEVSGTLSFIAPLTVSWLKSTTGVVNGVDLVNLYNNAWFIDTTTQVSTSVAFQGVVSISRGFFSQGTIDGLDVQKAYRESKAAQDGFRNVTTEFEAKFERVCLPIARLYNKLEACMYEADYLSFYGSLPLPEVAKESITFYAFGTTILLVSYEGACHLDLLSWHNGNFVLHQRVQHAGYGRHFYLLGNNDQEVLVAMAASPFNNTCEATNSTIWRVSSSGLEVYQKLGEAVYITEDTFGGKSLFLHGLHYTLSYTLDPRTNYWGLVATLPAYAGGVLVHPIYGVLHLLQDYNNETVYVRRVVPARSRGGVRLIFGLFSTVTSCRGPTHALKVFREINGTHHCVASASLPTIPADLTVFFAGSIAAGSHLAVVTMHYNFPIIFSFAGEVLSRWGELEEAPTATWVQHALVRRPGRHFPDYYILLGPLHYIPDKYTTGLNHTSHSYSQSPAPGTYNNPDSSSTSHPYAPPSTSLPYSTPSSISPTPGPYNIYSTTTTGSYLDDRYTRSASQYHSTAPKISVIYHLEMRGSAVAAANITCTRYHH